MNKIYGFKNGDILELIKDVNNRKKGEPLSALFVKFAQKTGKSKGTVRNMYYAVVKKSNEDKDFCAEFFGGCPLEVTRSEQFGKEEERNLVDAIAEGRKEGLSVRRIIWELSGKDAKKALRYQNKYRNVLKSNPQLVQTQESAYVRAGARNAETPAPSGIKNAMKSLYIKRLQSEINGLVERISQKVRNENLYLKNRMTELEAENVQLKKMLYGEGETKSGVLYFKNKMEKNIQN